MAPQCRQSAPRTGHSSHCSQRLLVLVVAFCAAARTAAYPAFYVQGYSNSCFDEPTKSIGMHGAPTDDA